MCRALAITMSIVRCVAYMWLLQFIFHICHGCRCIVQLYGCYHHNWPSKVEGDIFSPVWWKGFLQLISRRLYRTVEKAMYSPNDLSIVCKIIGRKHDKGKTVNAWPSACAWQTDIGQRVKLKIACKSRYKYVASHMGLKYRRLWHKSSMKQTDSNLSVSIWCLCDWSNRWSIHLAIHLLTSQFMFVLLNFCCPNLNLRICIKHTTTLAPLVFCLAYYRPHCILYYSKHDIFYSSSWTRKVATTIVSLRLLPLLESYPRRTLVFVGPF